MKGEVYLSVKVHFPSSVQTYRVARQVDGFKVNMFALNVELHIALGKSCVVGHRGSQNIEQRDDGRQLVDISVAKLNLSFALEGVDGRPTALEGHFGKDIALEFLRTGQSLVGESLKLSGAEPRADVVPLPERLD